MRTPHKWKGQQQRMQRARERIHHCSDALDLSTRHVQLKEFEDFNGAPTGPRTLQAYSHVVMRLQWSTHLHFQGGRAERNSRPDGSPGCCCCCPCWPPPCCCWGPACVPPGFVAPSAYFWCSVMHIECA